MHPHMHTRMHAHTMHTHTHILATAVKQLQSEGMFNKFIKDIINSKLSRSNEKSIKEPSRESQMFSSCTQLQKRHSFITAPCQLQKHHSFITAVYSFVAAAYT